MGNANQSAVRQAKVKNILAGILTVQQQENDLNVLNIALAYLSITSITFSS